MKNSKIDKWIAKDEIVDNDHGFSNNDCCPIDHDIIRMKLKIDLDLELDSKHHMDAFIDMNLRPHGCGNMNMNSGMDMNNMEMKPLTQNNAMNRNDNDRHDMGLILTHEVPTHGAPTTKVPSVLSLIHHPPPPTEQIISSGNNLEPHSNVVCASASNNEY